MDIDEGSATFPIRLSEGSAPCVVFLVISYLDNDSGAPGDFLCELGVLEEEFVELPDQGRVTLLKGFGHGSFPQEKVSVPSPVSQDILLRECPRRAEIHAQGRDGPLLWPA
jgi:hypothetical protein